MTTKVGDTSIWMPLYVGDYLSKTTRLTTEQHGAYLLLLLDYWKNGPPPDQDTVLAQITRLHLPKWMAIRKVLEEFFEVRNEVWISSHLDEEGRKAQENRALAQKRGKAGASARWGNKETNAPSIDGALTDAWKRDGPSPSPLPSPLPIQKTLSSKFDEFWNLWPQSKRKVGKVACLKKWKSSGLDAIAPKILSSVQALKTSEQWVTGFEPAPMTYIKQQRWEDDIGATTPMRRAIVGVSPVKLREFEKN